MFSELLLPGTVSFKETLVMYLEGLKDFFEEICYYIAKFELRM